MLRVALTGGLGSGKSTVAEFLREMGAPVSASDEVARAMMQPGEPLFERIVAEFGRDVVRADGELDRAVLARLAFREGGEDRLSALVHPPVIEAQERWLRGREAEGAAVAVVESALVLETRFRPEREGQPWRRYFQRVLLVTAPEEVRLRRAVERALQARPEADAAQVEADMRARMALQMPEAEKRAAADAVIENAGSQRELREETERLWRWLLAEAEEGARLRERDVPIRNKWVETAF